MLELRVSNWSNGRWIFNISRRDILLYEVSAEPISWFLLDLFKEGSDAFVSVESTLAQIL